MEEKVRESVVVKKEFEDGRVIYVNLAGQTDMLYQRNKMGQLEGPFKMLSTGYGNPVYETYYVDGVEQGPRIEKLDGANIYRESRVDNGVILDSQFKTSLDFHGKPISEEEVYEKLRQEAERMDKLNDDFDRDVINTALNEVFRDCGVDDYSFSDEVKEIFAEHLVNYDSPNDFFEDLINHGCRSGMIGELIYYSDTKDFYIRHMDDIEDYLEELDQPKLDSPHYNSAAWLIVEEMAYTVSPNFEEALQRTVSDRLDTELWNQEELKELHETTSFSIVRDYADKTLEQFQENEGYTETQQNTVQPKSYQSRKR